MKMCQAFAANGHEVTLYAHLDKNEKDIDAFNYYGVNKTFKIKPLINTKFPYFGHLNGLIMALKSKINKADMVIGRHPTGCYFSSLFGLKTYLEVHEPVNKSGKLTHFLFKNMLRLRNFYKLIVITKPLEQYYKNKYYKINKNIIVAPDGADPIPKNIKPVILKENGKLMKVGYVGHLYKGRGINIILALAGNCKWAEFHLIGGNTKDIDYWRNRIGYLDNVILHGFFPPSETQKFILAFDVLLAPYQNKLETASGANTVKWMSPLKLFEYMATGKPIICSDLPVLREVLAHEKNALLCKPSDVEDWKRNLGRLRDNHHLRQKLGKTAYKDFIIYYTWEARAKRLIDNFSREIKRNEEKVTKQKNNPDNL